MRLKAMALACLAVSTGAALADQPQEPLPAHYGLAIYELASFRRPCKPARASCPPACLEPAPIEPMPKAEVPRPDQPPIIEPSFAPEQAAAAGDYYAAVPPNMIGDLPPFGYGISFNYISIVDTDTLDFNFPVAGSVDLNSFTGLNVAKAAENNVALPTNRVYFRYNYFNSTNQMGGLGTGVPFPNPPSGVNEDSEFFAVTRDFDTHWFTFGVEKTFFGDLCSVELRIPFATSLDPDLDLNNGQLAPSILGGFFLDPIPGNSFGNYATDFGDLALLFKGLLYYSPRAALAGGLVLTAPTGPDSRVQITDFTVGTHDMRTRSFRIENETWSLSPYLGWLVQPANRLFVQGFYQFYFPIGSNSFDFHETLAGQTLASDGELDGQIYMLTDLGVGYWLARNRGGRRLTGLAPMVELHYATTLNNASLVALPNDNVPLQTNNPAVVLPPPVIGNPRNRMDFLNITGGLVAEFGNRLLVTVGASAPLRNDGDRYYDWEMQLQINYRFGPAPAYLEAPPPL